MPIAAFRLAHVLSHSPFSTPLSIPLSPLCRRCRRPPRLPHSIVSSSSPPRKRRTLSLPSRRLPPPALNLQSRGKGSLADREKGVSSQPSAMAESEKSGAGFNKRRAEGRDKSDAPKTLEKKIRKLNPVNTIAYVQIIGTGMDTQDTSSSVLLFFDHQRFIFNAGEGLQRFCTEHKIKLSKIDHIFLSRVSSETAGGLPGLLLTLAGEVGMCVNIWGPSDLDLLVKAMKLFIPNAAMVHTKSFGPLRSPEGNAIWDEKQFAEPIMLINDEVVKISAILLYPTDLMGSVKGKNGATINPGELSVVYVCELPEIQGKFDPEKAKSLGLKPGPKYRELQLNKSVKSDRLDIMVHPSDVMDPPIPGPIVLLVDCPTESHLQHLSSSSSLEVYYANQSEGAKKVNCIIHMSPSSVIKSSQYQKWMSRFGDMQHIFAGHERKNAQIPILKSSARVAARLNFLCPQFFPVSGVGPVAGNNSLVRCSDSSAEELSGVSAENLMKFNLRPYAQLGLDRSCIPSFVPHEGIIGELHEEIPEIEDAANQVRRLWMDMKGDKKNDTSAKSADVSRMGEPCLYKADLPNCLENITREDMEITLLGTGSSQPSKYRNVTSIFINLFSKGSMLFDCGEGTLGQLKRRFGLDGADNAVKNLRCIWISHIHADHHTGLARILALRCALLRGTPHEPLIVVGPRQLKGYLDAYQRLEDLDIHFLDCKQTTKDSWAAFDKSESNTTQSLLDDPNSDITRLNVEDTVFAKGRHMQSVFRKPGSPVDRNAAFPILKKLKKALQEADIEALVSFPVIHCPQAYGVVVNASERINSIGKGIPGWKIVYSGDTRPCPELVEASCGATVLIHEATFEDSMVEEAILKNHSTTSEAIAAGEMAGVYRIILTHFSQRYPKIPVFDDTHMHDTCIGFDLMSINMADLPVLPKVLPYLKLLFEDQILAEEESEGAAIQHTD